MNDVHNELTTLGEKQGNDTADMYAKQGAAVHGIIAGTFWPQNVMQLGITIIPT